MITTPDRPSSADVSEAYGRRLRRHREGAKLSQRDVAERVGASQSAVVKAERGEASEELLSKLERLYEMRDSYPAAPKHPLRRMEWMNARNAGFPAAARRHYGRAE